MDFELTTPLQFQPLLKRIRWGGTRLGSQLGKPIGSHTDYAESWEICDHGEDQSIVSSGHFQGQSLQQIITSSSEQLMGESDHRDQFPLLIKYLDCHDRLSVQVHPNDEQAKQYDPLENGKTEAWVVIDANPQSVIYAGLQEGVTREAFQQHLSAGTIEECLELHRPEIGDCYFIPAGTVHALGEGVLIAEVQQSSDLTFRLHDWGRLGADGQPRPLHIEQSLACIDFLSGPVTKQQPQVIAQHAGCQIESIVNSDYFLIERYMVESSVEIISQQRCQILMTLSGRGKLSFQEEVIEISAGSTQLIPAACSPVSIHADDSLVILKVTVP